MDSFNSFSIGKSSHTLWVGWVFFLSVNLISHKLQLRTTIDALAQIVSNEMLNVMFTEEQPVAVAVDLSGKGINIH